MGEEGQEGYNNPVVLKEPRGLIPQGRWDGDREVLLQP